MPGCPFPRAVLPCELGLPLPPAAMPRWQRLRPPSTRAHVGVFGPDLHVCRRRAHRPRAGPLVGDRGAGQAAARGGGAASRWPPATSASTTAASRFGSSGRGRGDRDGDGVRPELRVDGEQADLRRAAPCASTGGCSRSTRARRRRQRRLSPAAHRLEVERGRWLARRRPQRRLEPGERDPRLASGERADDLGGRRAGRGGPVDFAADLGSILFEDGARVRFSEWAERRDRTNLLLMRSYYRQPFGTFEGAAFGGLHWPRVTV